MQKKKARSTPAASRSGRGRPGARKVARATTSPRLDGEVPSKGMLIGYARVSHSAPARQRLYGKTLTLLYSDTLGQTGADLSEEDDEHDLVEKWTPRFRCQSKSMALSIFTKGRIRGLRVQPAHPKPETARLRPA
jgi:hypothetical protein